MNSQDMRYFPIYNRNLFAGCLCVLAAAAAINSGSLLKSPGAAALAAAPAKAGAILNVPGILGTPAESLGKKFGKMTKADAARFAEFPGPDSKENLAGYRSDAKGSFLIVPNIKEGKVYEIRLVSSTPFKTPEAFLKALGIDLKGAKPADDTESLQYVKVWRGKTKYPTVQYVRLHKTEIDHKEGWNIAKISGDSGADPSGG